MRRSPSVLDLLPQPEPLKESIPKEDLKMPADHVIEIPIYRILGRGEKMDKDTDFHAAAGASNAPINASAIVNVPDHAHGNPHRGSAVIFRQVSCVPLTIHVQ